MGREGEVTVEEEVDGKQVKGVKKEKLVEEVQSGTPPRSDRVSIVRNVHLSLPATKYHPSSLSFLSLSLLLLPQPFFSLFLLLLLRGSLK